MCFTDVLTTSSFLSNLLYRSPCTLPSVLHRSPCTLSPELSLDTAIERIKWHICRWRKILCTVFSHHLDSEFCTVLLKYILHCIISQKQTIILFFSSRVWCVIFVVPDILIVTTLRRKVELVLVPPRSRKQYLSFWLHNETKNVKYCCLTRCENCRILFSLPATSHNQQSRVSKYPLLDRLPLVCVFCRAGNEPSPSLMFHHHREGPYSGLVLVKNAW